MFTGSTAPAAASARSALRLHKVSRTDEMRLVEREPTVAERSSCDAVSHVPRSAGTTCNHVPAAHDHAAAAHPAAERRDPWPYGSRRSSGSAILHGARGRASLFCANSIAAASLRNPFPSRWLAPSHCLPGTHGAPQTRRLSLRASDAWRGRRECARYDQHEKLDGELAETRAAKRFSR